MNILLKIFVFLLLVGGLQSPLMAQKKLALANECFNAKAYYLASRYYQDFFKKQSDDCHPDQIKLAQSLAATQQLAKAATKFEAYMACQALSPTDYLAYGKFLIDIQAYEQAIPYFEQVMDAEPQLARHYLLVCQTAKPKPLEQPATVLIKNDHKQPANPVVAKEHPQNYPSEKALNFNLDETVPNSTNAPVLTASVSSTDTNQGDASTIAISAYKSSVPPIENHSSNFSNPKPIKTNLSLETKITTRIVKASKLEEEKKFSDYGVRLGSYQPASLPDLSSIEGYGRLEQKKWNGKVIFFLVDFPSRVEAEATVKAIQEKFRSAILVKKLPSGRMKSVR